MRTLVVYESKYGSTAQCVELLKQAMPGDVRLCNLAYEAPIKPDYFDAVIIGGPIYSGKLPTKLRTYCEKQRLELTTKKLGLFVCGIMNNEAALKEMAIVFPDGLQQAAYQKGYFGGAIYLDQMSALERVMTRLFKYKSGSNKWQKNDRGWYIEQFENDQIEHFAKAMFNQSAQYF